MGETDRQQQINLVIVDAEHQFLPHTEEEIIRRYADNMTVQLITDRNALAWFFEKPRSVNVLVIEKESYGDFLKDHDIRHTLLLAPEIGMEESSPDNLEVLLKYLPAAEILHRIEELLQKDGIIQADQEEEEVQHNTRVIAVYSPIGGCGKSLVSYALAKKLRRLDQKVLLVSCDATQSASVYFPTESFAKEELAEKLIHPDGETYWTILQNIEQSGISYILPFEKMLPSLEIGMQQWEVLLTVLCEKRDFDYIILDMGSALNRETASLMTRVNFLILLTETNLIANRKMQKLLRDSELLPKCECFLVANEYRADGMRIAAESVFGTIAPYPTWEEALEDPVFYQIALKVIE